MSTLDLQDLQDLADIENMDAADETMAAALIQPTADLGLLPKDPSLPPYPRGLIMDIVLRTAPIEDLLVAYKLTTDDFRILAQHPIFRQDIREMKDKVKEEGFSFRVKAAAQSEAYLTQAWNMVHDQAVPANVRADILKWTVKVAGLDSPQTALSPSMDLSKLAEEIKSLPYDQLEMRAFQIILKKSANQPVQTQNADIIDA